MFGSSSKNGNGSEINPGALNLINAGTSINGDIHSNGDIRIDGSLSGTINTKSKLVVGQTGKVEGDIEAQNSDISGTVRGNIVVTELLTLKATAKVRGDISTKKLIIEVGAEFDGKCTMRSGTNELVGKHDLNSNGTTAPKREQKVAAVVQ